MSIDRGVLCPSVNYVTSDYVNKYARHVYVCLHLYAKHNMSAVASKINDITTYCTLQSGDRTARSLLPERLALVSSRVLPLTWRLQCRAALKMTILFGLAPLEFSMHGRKNDANELPLNPGTRKNQRKH